MISRWRTAWTTTMDRQHRLPQGLLGQLVGEKMVRQHRPETDWTVGLLDLQPADRILELGCGAGRGLLLAARAVGLGMTIGMDLSPTMLQAAARRTRRAGQGNRINLLRGNLEALPYADGSLNKIWSVHTFYFWSDPEAVIAELLRTLAPGGLIVVTLATGTVSPSGADQFWPLHYQVEALVQTLSQRYGSSAELRRGPNSRHYNNLALVLRKDANGRRLW
jgi:ubiquinone/menaquinone biosynthesis C-methylase UbiE